MVSIAVVGTVALLAVASCGHSAAPVAPAPAPACAPREDADTKVVKAIVDMYAAFQVDDRAGFRAVTTPDFYAFELGKRMDGDELVAMIADAHGKGRRFEWMVTQPTVRVDCNLAIVTYTNVGAIGDASGMQPRSWVESAALTYEAGAWRVRFFHSTRAPQE